MKTAFWNTWTYVPAEMDIGISDLCVKRVRMWEVQWPEALGYGVMTL